MMLPPHTPAKTSVLQVYPRLLSYAWRYKVRLLISLFFAIVVAVSFGGMIMGIATVVRLTFYDAGKVAVTSPADSTPNTMSVKEDPAENSAQKDVETAEPTVEITNTKEDPAENIAQKIVEYTEKMHYYVGWAPSGIDQRFLDVVAQMRADKMHALALACKIILVLAFMTAIARYLQAYLAGSIGTAITLELEAEMFQNMVRQPMAYFESHSSGDLVARFTNDCFMVNRGLSDVLVKLMCEPFKVLFFMAIALRQDFWVALLGICVLPPVFIILVQIGKQMRRAIRRTLQRIGGLISIISEAFVGIQIVKAYNMEGYETQRVQDSINKLRRYLLRSVRLDAAASPITEFLLMCGVVAFVMFSGQRVHDKSLPLDALIALPLALLFMMDPVRKLSAVNNMVQTSVASAERVFEFIDMKPTMLEAPDAVTIPTLHDAIRLDNVHFSYDGETEVLKGITLDIRKGEMVALVGFSGAGKSTLVKLLPRFYDVTDGSLTIDGVDVRQATYQSLREQISIVPQETVLFAESARDNIAFGSTRYSDERVQEAARAAHAHEFIEKLPQGYDTVLGESGCTLSGGQRQRLAIARAIIKDPAVLILDEATSSLDSESERLIQDALDRFVSGRTAIVIAHRLSTVQRADRIVVLDQGRIAEMGTHTELLAHEGIYRRLYDTQFGTRNE